MPVFQIAEEAQLFWRTLSEEKEMYLTLLSNNALGNIFGDSFTISSGHPARDQAQDGARHLGREEKREKCKKIIKINASQLKSELECKNLNVGRVTRLGEFSLIRRVSTLGRFF
jgi:hypothetical protein